MSSQQMEHLLYHARLKDQLNRLLSQRERALCAITAALDFIDEKKAPKVAAELRATLKELRS